MNLMRRILTTATLRARRVEFECNDLMKVAVNGTGYNAIFKHPSIKNHIFYGVVAVVPSWLKSFWPLTKTV